MENEAKVPTIEEWLERVRQDNPLRRYAEHAAEVASYRSAAEGATVRIYLAVDGYHVVAVGEQEAKLRELYENARLRAEVRP